MMQAYVTRINIRRTIYLVSISKLVGEPPFILEDIFIIKVIFLVYSYNDEGGCILTSLFILKVS